MVAQSKLGENKMDVVLKDIKTSISVSTRRLDVCASPALRE